MLPILVIITTIVLVIASITDIRKREVPDWLSYSVIAMGLGIRGIYSIVWHETSTILYGAYGFLVMLVIGVIMYYAGQWGGGDSKILMGLGSMIGFNLGADSLLPGFLVLMLFTGGVYGLGYSIVLAIKNWPKFADKFSEVKARYHNTRRILILLSVSLVIASFFVNIYLRLMLISFAFIIVLTLYSLIFAKIVDKVCMQKHVEPEKLTEGDWIVNDIIIDKKVICGPKDLGISKEQIKELIELKKNKKIDKVLIKEGIPFVPSFLAAYLITMILYYNNINIISLFFGNI